MDWLDFLVLTLAASAVIDVWFNGSLFADWRAFFQTTEDDSDDGPIPAVAEPGTELPFLMRMVDKWVPDWVAEILSCHFCFSYHAPWIVGLVCYLPASLVPWSGLAFLLKLPAYSLAATRLGNLLNAWAPVGAKYERD